MAPAGTGRLPSLSSTSHCIALLVHRPLTLQFTSDLFAYCDLLLFLGYWIFLHGLHFQVSCSEFLRCTSPQHHLLNHFLHPHFNHLL